MRLSALQRTLVALLAVSLLGAAGLVAQAAVGQGTSDKTAAELLAEAAKALGQGNPEAALPLTQQAVTLAPDDPEVYYQQGLAYQALARENEAEQAFGKAVRLRPSVPRYHYSLGLAYRQTGKENLALAEFLQVLRLEPDDPAAHHQAGELLMDQGDAQGAVKHWEAALRAAPDFTPALKALGQHKYSEGQLDEAISFWERAAQHDAFDADLWWRLARAWGERQKGDDLANAVWALRQFRNLAPPSTDQELIEHADRVLAGNADQAARRFLVRGLEVQQDPAKAVVYFNRALDLCPDFAEAHYNRGVALQRLGRHNEAVSAYLQAAELAPGQAAQAAIHTNLGTAYLALKRPFQAERELRKALELAPEDRTIRLNLALALWQQGSVAEGRVALQALLKEDPQFASAYYNLACLEANAGRRADALDALRKAIGLNAGYREMARQDPDLASLAEDPDFRALVAGP
ncbi:MAG: tetratricopeptide repeat protein [Betaproteobacteria bacterium]